jgi:hypothetical protein
VTNSIKAEKIYGDKTNSVVIYISNSGLEFKYGMLSSDKILWEQISEIEVEGADAIQKRITASRLLAIGIFAFAFKKKTGEAFAFISFKDGREAHVYRFPKKSEPEVKAFFATSRSKINRSAPAESSETEDTSVEQLMKLGEMFKQGLVDESEFKAGKAKILGLS